MTPRRKWYHIRADLSSTHRGVYCGGDPQTLLSGLHSNQSKIRAKPAHPRTPWPRITQWVDALYLGSHPGDGRRLRLEGGRKVATRRPVSSARRGNAGIPTARAARLMSWGAGTTATGTALPVGAPPLRAVWALQVTKRVTSMPGNGRPATVRPGSRLGARRPVAFPAPAAARRTDPARDVRANTVPVPRHDLTSWADAPGTRLEPTERRRGASPHHGVHLYARTVPSIQPTTT